MFKSIHMMHTEHSHHEENILYPFLNGYLPGYTRFVTQVPAPPSCEWECRMLMGVCDSCRNI